MACSLNASYTISPSYEKCSDCDADFAAKPVLEASWKCIDALNQWEASILKDSKTSSETKKMLLKADRRSRRAYHNLIIEFSTKTCTKPDHPKYETVPVQDFSWDFLTKPNSWQAFQDMCEQREKICAENEKESKAK